MVVIKKVPLMVKCWSVLARQFSAPCPAQQQQQQHGKHRVRRGYGPCRRKNGPLILVLVSLGLPLGLEQIWFSAEHGSLSRERLWFPPRRGCVITGFSLDQETPLAGWLTGWLIWGQLFGYLTLHSRLSTMQHLSMPQTWKTTTR